MGQIGTYDPVWLNKLNYFLLIKWDKKLLKNQHQTPAVCILIIERFSFFFHSLTGMLSLKFTACHIFQPPTMCA